MQSMSRFWVNTTRRMPSFIKIYFKLWKWMEWIEKQARAGKYLVRDLSFTYGP